MYGLTQVRRRIGSKRGAGTWILRPETVSVTTATVTSQAVPLLLTCISTINGELFDASSLETGVDTHTHTLIEMHTDVNAVPRASLSEKPKNPGQG